MEDRTNEYFEILLENKYGDPGKIAGAFEGAGAKELTDSQKIWCFLESQFQGVEEHWDKKIIFKLRRENGGKKEEIDWAFIYLEFAGMFECWQMFQWILDNKPAFTSEEVANTVKMLVSEDEVRLELVEQLKTKASAEAQLIIQNQLDLVAMAIVKKIAGRGVKPERLLVLIDCLQQLAQAGADFLQKAPNGLNALEQAFLVQYRILQEPLVKFIFTYIPKVSPVDQQLMVERLQRFSGKETIPEWLSDAYEKRLQACEQEKRSAFDELRKAVGWVESVTIRANKLAVNEFSWNLALEVASLEFKLDKSDEDFLKLKREYFEMLVMRNQEKPSVLRSIPLALQSGIGSVSRFTREGNKKLLTKAFASRPNEYVRACIANWFSQVSQQIVAAYAEKMIPKNQRESTTVGTLLKMRVEKVDFALKRYFFDAPELELSFECLTSLRDFLIEKVYTERINWNWEDQKNFEAFLSICKEWGKERLSIQRQAFGKQDEEAPQDEVRELLSAKK